MPASRPPFRPDHLCIRFTTPAPGCGWYGGESLAMRSLPANWQGSGGPAPASRWPDLVGPLEGPDRSDRDECPEPVDFVRSDAVAAARRCSPIQLLKFEPPLRDAAATPPEPIANRHARRMRPADKCPWRVKFRSRWLNRLQGREVLIVDDVMTTGALPTRFATILHEPVVARVSLAVAAWQCERNEHTSVRSIPNKKLFWSWSDWIVTTLALPNSFRVLTSFRKGGNLRPNRFAPFPLPESGHELPQRPTEAGGSMKDPNTLASWRQQNDSLSKRKPSINAPVPAMAVPGERSCGG